MEDSTYTHFKDYSVKSGTSHNMVAMTGGKYNIPKNALLYKLPFIMQKHENISLVYFLSQEAHCILFFDVDQEIDIPAVEIKIRSYLSTKFSSETSTEELEIFITKNTSFNKYHIYLPTIRVTKATLKRITLGLNRTFGSTMFDVSVCTGAALKIDGFNKYSNATEKYEPNTRYMPIARCACSNQQMWEKTYLFADAPLTVLQHELNLYVDLPMSMQLPETEIDLEVSTDLKINTTGNNNENNTTYMAFPNTNTHNSKNKHDKHNKHKNKHNKRNNKHHKRTNKQSKPHKNTHNSKHQNYYKMTFETNSEDDNFDSSPSKSGSENLLATNEEQKEVSDEENVADFINLIDSYPWAKSYMDRVYRQHIIRTSESKDGRYTFFDFDKSSTGRMCPFTNRKHKNNNQYLKLDKEQQCLFQECHHPDCKTKSRLLAHNVGNEILDMSISELGLATLFVKISPTLFLAKNSKTCKKRDYYYFNGIYWQLDSQKIHLWRLLTISFKHSLESTMEDEMSQTDDKHLLKLLHIRKSKITSMLSSTGTTQSIMTQIGFIVYRDNFRFNNKTDNLVFKNGIWDLRTGEFGASLPDELISNEQTTGVEYEEANEEKMEILKREFIHKILPDENERTTFLNHLSTALCGRNQKFLMISYCPKANNAKTSISSLMLYALGKSTIGEHYAKKMNSSMLVGLKSDEASLHTLTKIRYCIIEEPDSRRPINGATIKDLTNGSEDCAARGFMSDDCNVILMQTMHLNCNIIPNIEPMDAGVEKRLRIFQFRSTFVSDPSLVKESDHVYLENKKMLQESWQKKHAMQFLHILRKHLVEYYNNNDTYINHPTAD